MVKIEIKQQELAKELECIEDRIRDLVDKIGKSNPSASEYAQIVAEYHVWLRRYDRVDTQMRIMKVSPSKRTQMTERNLRMTNQTIE